MKWLIFAVLLSSCGPDFHLKRAKLHLLKAEAKGATISPDTIFQIKEVIVPSLRIDTVFRFVSLSDTITITKDRVVTRVKYDTVSRQIFVSTVCPPDTLFVDVPISVHTDIKAKGKSGMELILWLLVSVSIGAVFSRLFWR